MVKILHGADLHLDSAFTALDRDKAAERRAHQRTLVQKIVEIGNEEKVDLILLSGDMFDSKNAFGNTAEALSRAFEKSNARIFISPGNHDHFTPESPYNMAVFGENVHVFKRDSIEKVEIPELNCVVYGAGFVSASCEKPLLEDFCAEDEGVKIMVLHGEVTNQPSKYNPISIAQIEKSNLNYLALGHIHATDGVCKAGNTYYAYAGAPEGRGFDETGDKGIYIGTVGEQGVNLEFRKISPYTYTECIIDVKNNGVESALDGDHGFDVRRVILEGEIESIDVKALLNKYEKNFYNLTILDRTTPPVDLWEGLEEDSLKGLFLRKLKALDIDEEICEMAARYGVAAIENKEGV